MEQTTITKKSVAYMQLQSIIQEILESQNYPKWDFVNNVLSCKEILGDNQLWFHWGKLLIHKPSDEGKNAGEHYELDDWNTAEDGTITLLGKKQNE